LAGLFRDLVASPEFCFSEGDFFRRLEHACYYQIGNFQYPARLLLHALFQLLSEKFEVAVVVQDIQLKIVRDSVYHIGCEAAIMAQDTNHVIGPVEELFPEDTTELQQDMEKTLLELQNFKPHKLGEVLISSPSWCKAKYLLEAVIYRFEEEEITNEKVVRAVLVQCLQNCNSLKIHKLAMDALGTEYHVLPPHRFVHILHETLMQLAGQVPSIKEVSIAVRDQEHANALKKAFVDVLNIKIP
jgi:O-acetyl-ADP-ribose deacetylase (regulator of RNase III)